MADAAGIAGREAELDHLVSLVRQADAGRGTTVFLSGEPGMGRRTLLEGLRATGGDEPGAPAFHVARCRAEDAQLNAYQPFAELLRELVAGDPRASRRRVGKAVLGALEATAPTWLSMVPVVGAGIGATWVSVTQKLREVDVSGLQLQAGSVILLAREFEQALRASLEDDRTLVLVLAHAQWIDPPSLELLSELQDFISRNRVLVVVSFRATVVEDDQPLPARIRELVARGHAQLVELGPLDRSALRAHVQARHGLRVPDSLEDWLLAYTGGNPLFLDGLMEQLRDPRTGALRREGDRVTLDEALLDDTGALRPERLAEAVQLPSNVEMVLEQRLQQLSPEERRLLQIGAVEGERFLISTLIHAARVDEEAVVDALAELAHDRVVREAEGGGWSFAYEFMHQLLRRRLYDSLSGPQRALRHREIAAALEAVYGERAPRTALLDIAHHNELGGRPFEAAGYYHRAAQTAYLDGALGEARGLAETGLRLVRGLLDNPAQLRTDQGPAVERLRAELVLLTLGATDFRWVGSSRDEQEVLVDLYNEGLAAAAEAHDDALLARFHHVRGGMELTRGDVRRARASLETAAELSGQTGDEIARLAALIDLANLLDVDDIAAGKALLAESRDLATRLRSGATKPVARELDRLAARLDAMEGIADSDSGQLGTALRLLERSIATLQRLGHLSDLPRVVNYWAQTALVACDFQGARQRLEDVLAATAAAPNPWNAYNRALSGKVLLDAGLPQEATEWVLGGWQELQVAPDSSLAAIVGLYVIELRLAEEGDSVDALIREQIQAAESLGLHYAAAAARTLAAERDLGRGRPDDALAAAEPAVQLVDKAQHLPVVRSEEVFATKARCLAALGRTDEAARWRDRALGVLAAKAASLGDAAAAERMLTSAPAARRLAAAALGEGPPTSPAGVPSG